MWVAAALCLGVVALQLPWLRTEGLYFFESVQARKLEAFFAALAALGTFFSLVILGAMVRRGQHQAHKGLGERLLLYLGVLLGTLAMIFSRHLLLFYLGMELSSLCAYLLVGFRFTKLGYAGGLKYLILGGTSSALFLYGLSFFFGISGDFLVHESVNLLADEAYFYPAQLAVLFLVAGALFKISAAPMHFWTPEVYRSGPLDAVALISYVPKVGGFMLLIRLAEMLRNGPLHDSWHLLLAATALGSILVGNFGALRQSGFRKILAFSGIAHTGFMLTGLLGEGQPDQAFLFYLLAFMPMNYAIFMVLQIMEARTGTDELKSFAGAGRRFPVFGAGLVISLLGLIGLPPTGGFVAKLLVFSVVWEEYELQGSPLYFWLFILGLLNTALALFYYIKPIYYAYIERKEKPIPMQGPSPLKRTVVLFLSLLILLLFFKSDLFFLFFQK